MNLYWNLNNNLTVWGYQNQIDITFQVNPVNKNLNLDLNLSPIWQQIDLNKTKKMFLIIGENARFSDIRTLYVWLQTSFLFSPKDLIIVDFSFQIKDNFTNQDLEKIIKQVETKNFLQKYQKPSIFYPRSIVYKTFN